MADVDTSTRRDYAPRDAQLFRDSERATTRRWRERRAERRRARLVSPRHRRALARMLRGIAKDAVDPNPLRRPLDVLLHYRAAAVRTDLLEIAALLERAQDPDPSCVAALRQLVRDGASPLYDPAVHVSELHTALHYAHAGLSNHP